MDPDYTLKKIIMDISETTLNEEKIDKFIQEIRQNVFPDNKNMELNKENTYLKQELQYYMKIINAVGTIMDQHNIVNELKEFNKNV